MDIDCSLKIVHLCNSDYCIGSSLKCIWQRQRFTDRCFQMLLAFRAFPEFCKISRALPRVRVSVARYSMLQREAWENPLLYSHRPIEFKVIESEQFSLRYQSLKSDENLRGEWKKEVLGFWRGIDNRHRVGILLAFVANGASTSRKWRKKHRWKTRADKKLRSQTVTETFNVNHPCFSSLCSAHEKTTS